MHDSVLTEAATVVALSHELRWSCEKANNLEELKLEEFANALIRDLPKFTAASFFEVNKSSILSLLWIVTNFLIVMFQFGLANNLLM
jgi:hypothetical protein